MSPHLYRQLLATSALILTGFAWSHGGPVPIGKPPHYPDWWFKFDVISLSDPENEYPDYINEGTYPKPDDFAVANLGQLKHIAYQASLAMEEELLPWGPGDEIIAFVDVWILSGSPGEQREDFAALNQGQLKAVAYPFYKRLRQTGYFGPPLTSGQTYPWDGASSTDPYAVVNVGQLKYMFSFFAGSYFVDSYQADYDLDGMADGWELEQGLDPFDPADAATTTQGATNLQRYQQFASAQAAETSILTIFSP